MRFSFQPRVGCESSEEDRGSNGPTKRSVSLSTDSPTESPVKRRRGRPPSANKVPGRRVGRPSKKVQDAADDSSPGAGEQLTDLLEQMIREDGQHGKEDEGETDREEVRLVKHWEYEGLCICNHGTCVLDDNGVH